MSLKEFELSYSFFLRDLVTLGIKGGSDRGGRVGEDEFEDQPRLINFHESFELKPYIKEHSLEDTTLCIL